MENNSREDVERIQSFKTDDLGTRIADLEALFQGANATNSGRLANQIPMDHELLHLAFNVKSAAGQINIIIHAAGILLSLPYLLEKNEVVESLSLGAGSTGKRFDMETNKRVAEFKFIQWRDHLAEYETKKTKCLYVLGAEIPLKFFNGGRSLSSVLSRNNKLWSEFQEKYGLRFDTVREYYQYQKQAVCLIDLKSVTPLFLDF